MAAAFALLALGCTGAPDDDAGHADALDAGSEDGGARDAGDFVDAGRVDSGVGDDGGGAGDDAGTLGAPPWCDGFDGGGVPATFPLPLPVVDALDADDCATLPDVVTPVKRTGPRSTEDFSFDKQGYLIGIDSYGVMWRSPQFGTPHVFLPGATSGPSTGVATLPDGEFVFADAASTLFRVTHEGSKVAVLSDLAFPNGVTVDLDGMIYVAEQNSGTVRRVDPLSGDYEIIATGLWNANGLAFNDTHDVLFVSSFGGGTLHAILFDAERDVVDVVLFRSHLATLGGGGLDGVAVDACGNVYVTEYSVGVLWRVAWHGCRAEPLAQFGFWIPNLEWGSGLGGWSASTLYVADIDQNTLWEITDIGVRGARKPGF